MDVGVFALKCERLGRSFIICQLDHVSEIALNHPQRCILARLPINTNQTQPLPNQLGYMV